MRRLEIGRAAAAAGMAAAVMLAGAAPAAANDYPTEARVDYVIGCMASNGYSYLTMQKCSCSIDVIASMIPYAHYEEVETVMRMQDQRGELGVLFRTERTIDERMQQFKQAQVEADLRCF